MSVRILHEKRDDYYTRLIKPIARLDVHHHGITLFTENYPSNPTEETSAKAEADYSFVIISYQGRNLYINMHYWIFAHYFQREINSHFQEYRYHNLDILREILFLYNYSLPKDIREKTKYVLTSRVVEYSEVARSL